MAVLRYQAWRFCRMLRAHPDPDPANAVYCRTRNESFDSQEFLEKYGSEVVGGMKTAELNEDHVLIKFELALLHEFSSSIGKSEVRRFFHYMEVAELIEIETRSGHETVNPKRSGSIEIASVNPDRTEVYMTVRLTNDGINFADSTILSIFPVETTAIFSMLAIIISTVAFLR